MTQVECLQVQTDRRWPFCRPSWLLFAGQNPYSNLRESLKEATEKMKFGKKLLS